jgi:hypothetical protein
VALPLHASVRRRWNPEKGDALACAALASRTPRPPPIRRKPMPHRRQCHSFLTPFLLPQNGRFSSAPTGGFCAPPDSRTSRHCHAAHRNARQPGGVGKIRRAVLHVTVQVLVAGGKTRWVLTAGRRLQRLRRHLLQIQRRQTISHFPRRSKRFSCRRAVETSNLQRRRGSEYRHR